MLAVAFVVVAVGLLARSNTPPSDNPYLGDQLLLGAFLVPAGGLVAWSRPGHRLGWLVLAAGVLYWLTFAGQPGVLWLIIHHSGWELLIRGLLAIGVSAWLVGRGVLLALVPLCYPAAKPNSGLGRTLWVVASSGIAVAALAHSRLYTPAYFNGVEPTGLASVAERVEPWAWRVVLVSSVIAIVRMFVLVARLPGDERRRHFPLAVTASVLLVPSVTSLYSEFSNSVHFDWSETVLVWTTVAFPCVLLYGVARHGLLDVRIVVRRSTVYALTALALVALYAAVIWVVTAAVSGDEDASRVIATAAVALAAMPVYVASHQFVERRLFGRRGDPAAVLGAIGTTVAQAPQGAAALELVTDTLCRELRLPYAAVDLHIATEGEPEALLMVRVASAGQPTEDVESFDLVGQDGTIGELVVARRTPHEPFRRHEMEALQGIARHVAVLASNVALTEQLLVSRRHLVTAREEERRRIRRDLHDGLGPTLASVCLGLGAACERIGNDTDLGSLLNQLEDELHAAVDEIRRLVYDLRPPALDELGLVGAVRDHVATLAARSTDATTPVKLEVNGSLISDQLPAAVEVAAYRIALEAITNVARHAVADHCWIRFDTSVDTLHVEVEDDGRGMASTFRAGIGLRSMRDRATELGGELLVRSCTPHGTLVRASIPLSLTAGGLAT